MMTPADLETVYEAMAEQLDAIAPTKRELFLAKLVLLLSNDLADAERVRQCIAEAAGNLDA
ncbi:DUF2783 domain-containing protein [Roseibium sediminicola]|uniref:DUF2783 domain-containing protein n=1 Tax=Roseibium sediminicola TaxID=2933272 RepID=A0ABT0GN56_9HYPH|nr:DUF2783 domain-containing protein [Roseibium sp. CAU 1639]MCK7610850.1 DUF2783 domain-containing protein [Roseibium sp. CAU 1639]